MTMNVPADQLQAPRSQFLVAAPRKSSGKTTVAVGLCAALARRKLAVAPFKKGPDYIDPTWLGRAAGRACLNLDFHTMTVDEIGAVFRRWSADADVAVVEGTMALHDSVDPEGGSGNAALARLLGIPVVLVADCTGLARSVAPLILGLQHFDRSLRIAGVILNRVAGSRHEGKLRDAVERYTDLPLLGAVPRDEELMIGERNLGLTPGNEYRGADLRIERIAARVDAGVDLDRLLEVTCCDVVDTPVAALAGRVAGGPSRVRIGVASDAAFGFYYADDLEAFRRAGAELRFIDTLTDSGLPEVDGLFIGGGFPEVLAPRLEGNAEMRADVRRFVNGGGPVYAECGGLMYLCRSIDNGAGRHAMCGVLEAAVVMRARPVGRGYTVLEPTAEHPWPGPNAGLTAAHEFHHSLLTGLDPATRFAWRVRRGHGIDGRHDGIVRGPLLAGYSHLRNAGGNAWVERFVDYVDGNRPAPAARGSRSAACPLS